MVHICEELDVQVDRGPNWLFVKLPKSDKNLDDAPHMADELWSISSKHFIYRLVLEMEGLKQLPNSVMSQLVLLQERLAERGGSLKLCGLSPECVQALHDCRLEAALPSFESREQAVRGAARREC